MMKIWIRNGEDDDDNDKNDIPLLTESPRSEIANVKRMAYAKLKNFSNNSNKMNLIDNMR